MRTAVRRFARNTIAAIARDRRVREPYTYRWLNNLCGEMFAAGGAAERRPAYAWGVIQAAALARRLGCKSVSVLEFGVAGGRGLIALEQIAEEVERSFGVAIQVYGFDTGRGLPKPVDVRDLPQLYSAETYVMDEAKLRAELRRAKLILGDVAETVSAFMTTEIAPIGFASFDLDYYSSTMDAFRIFDGPGGKLLPRVHCYMDDIMGGTFGDCNGERLAISDFNAGHATTKISPIYGLGHFMPWPLSKDLWCEMMYMAHMFSHASYAANDGLVARSTAPIGGA